MNYIERFLIKLMLTLILCGCGKNSTDIDSIEYDPNHYDKYIESKLHDGILYEQVIASLGDPFSVESISNNRKVVTYQMNLGSLELMDKISNKGDFIYGVLFVFDEGGNLIHKEYSRGSTTY